MRDKSIIVYHGSDRIIVQPDTEDSRLRVDFGRDFIPHRFMRKQKSGVKNIQHGGKTGSSHTMNLMCLFIKNALFSLLKPMPKHGLILF